jgi:hypothetical protein
VNEAIIGSISAAILALVGGLLAAFWKVWTDREALHVKEITRKDEECSFNLGRVKQDLVEARLYAASLEKDKATLERENDAWRNIAGTLRDRCSMLQVILDTKQIPIPEDRRNVTKPLNDMLAEHLEKQGKTP